MRNQQLKATLTAETSAIERLAAVERRDFTATEAARLYELSSDINRIEAEAEADDGWNVF